MKNISYLIFLLINLLILNKSYSQNKEIKLATLAWEPYIGPELKNYGPVAQIIKEALKKEGYNLKLEFMPWARAKVEAEKGVDGIDGYMPKYFDKAITDKFYFSLPFFDSDVGFFIKKEDKKKIEYTYVKNDLNKTYDKLKNFKFGICRGYVNEEKFDLRNDLTKIDVTNDEMNLLNLLTGTVDLIFIDKNVAKYCIRNNAKLLDNKNSLTFLEPEVYKHKLYIVFSKKAKDAELKLKAFNNGLGAIIKENRINLIKNEYEDFK